MVQPFRVLADSDSIVVRQPSGFHVGVGCGGFFWDGDVVESQEIVCDVSGAAETIAVSELVVDLTQGGIGRDVEHEVVHGAIDNDPADEFDPCSWNSCQLGSSVSYEYTGRSSVAHF